MQKRAKITSSDNESDEEYVPANMHRYNTRMRLRPSFIKHLTTAGDSDEESLHDSDGGDPDEDRYDLGSFIARDDSEISYENDGVDAEPEPENEAEDEGAANGVSAGGNAGGDEEYANKDLRAFACAENAKDIFARDALERAMNGLFKTTRVDPCAYELDVFNRPFDRILASPFYLREVRPNLMTFVSQFGCQNVAKAMHFQNALKIILENGNIDVIRASHGTKMPYKCSACGKGNTIKETYDWMIIDRRTTEKTMLRLGSACHSRVYCLLRAMNSLRDNSCTAGVGYNAFKTGRKYEAHDALSSLRSFLDFSQQAIEAVERDAKNW